MGLKTPENRMKEKGNETVGGELRGWEVERREGEGG